MNFAFSNLLGAPYRGGNLVLDGRELLSAVGNRVSQVGRAHACLTAELCLPMFRLLIASNVQTDLTNNSTTTFPFECSKQASPPDAQPQA